MKSIKPLQKYLMGAAALLGLVCPASAEPSATASGTEMVTPASYQALTRYRSYFTELPATDTAPMGFRVTSPERLDPIWRVGAFMSTTGDIAKGDLLVLSMQIRGAGSRPDSAKILFKLQDSSWVGVIREEVPAREAWQTVRYVGIADKDYASGALSLCVYPALDRQTLEVRALSLQNWGKTRKEDLPALAVPLPVQPGDAVLQPPEPPKPLVLEPLTPEQKATKRYVMLKLDDLVNRGEKQGPPWRWIELANYFKEKGLHASFGVIVKSIENDNPAYNEWIRKTAIENGGNIEFWHHGFTHAMNFDFNGKKCVAEFSGPDEAYMMDAFSRAMNAFREKTGLTFRTYGAPGNATDATGRKVLEAHPDIKVWLYGDARNPAGKLVLRRSLNLEHAVGKVDYQTFLRAYQNQRMRDYLVLQGHPMMWDAARLEAFKQIVEQLQEDGWIFVTPYEFSQLPRP